MNSTSHKYLIFGRAGCPWCEKAVDLLCRLGVCYEYRQLGVDYTREDLEKKIPGVKTVPQIFLDDELIGGYDKLSRMLGGNGSLPPPSIELSPEEHEVLRQAIWDSAEIVAAGRLDQVSSRC